MDWNVYRLIAFSGSAVSLVMGMVTSIFYLDSIVNEFLSVGHMGGIFLVCFWASSALFSFFAPVIFVFGIGFIGGLRSFLWQSPSLNFENISNTLKFLELVMFCYSLGILIGKPGYSYSVIWGGCSLLCAILFRNGRKLMNTMKNK